MDISKINKRVNNTPENIREELMPISDEYIVELVGTTGDESNPLDYYTKMEIDNKITTINGEIETVKTNIIDVDTKIDSLEEEVTSSISQVNDKITSLEEKAQDITKITYSMIEPTVDMGKDGDMWVIYEG